MLAKSGSADRPRSGGRAPRWVLEALAWLSVPSVFVEGNNCPGDQAAEFCRHFSNTVGRLFELFPGASLAFLELTGWSMPSALAATVILTAACHLLIRRLLPARIGVGVLVGAYLAAFALGYLIQGVGWVLLAGLSPWTHLRLILWPYG